LSEEEKMLLGYIDRNPEHAALLAEARIDYWRHEADERRRIEAEAQLDTQ
jgi:hypothetical protein